MSVFFVEVKHKILKISLVDLSSVANWAKTLCKSISCEMEGVHMVNELALSEFENGVIFHVGRT